MSRLEDVSLPFRTCSIARNEYDENDKYEVGHPNALSTGDEKLTNELMKIIIDLRQEAKERKEWQRSDKIRNDLKNIGIALKDLKEGADWERE